MSTLDKDKKFEELVNSDKEINKLKGVGPQLSKYLKKRKIEKIKDIILNLPYSETDRSKISKINKLEIGKIQSVKVIVKKINFPRIRKPRNFMLTTKLSFL